MKTGELWCREPAVLTMSTPAAALTAQWTIGPIFISRIETQKNFHWNVVFVPRTAAAPPLPGLSRGSPAQQRLSRQAGPPSHLAATSLNGSGFSPAHPEWCVLSSRAVVRCVVSPPSISRQRDNRANTGRPAPLARLDNSSPHNSCLSLPVQWLSYLVGRLAQSRHCRQKHLFHIQYVNQKS